MATIGPALATWVRHRRWAAGAESWAIILAVVLGFIGGAAADSWSSEGIRVSLHMKEVPEHEQKISDLDQAKTAIFGLLGGFLYFAVGGASGFARLLLGAPTFACSPPRILPSSIVTCGWPCFRHRWNTHFLFNTLASIRPLIRQHAAQAEAALDALADHLRVTIPQMREQSRAVVSTLGQQLDICTSYLKVMQVRMGARLQQEISVPDELRALAFPPPMLLSLVGECDQAWRRAQARAGPHLLAS